MKRGLLLPLLAACGAVIAIVVIVIDERPAAPPLPAIQSVEPPFATYITGAGTVEAVSGNIDIGTPVPGIVTDIFVQVGDLVKAGDALFTIDDRDLKAALQMAIANAKLVKTAIQKPEHRLQYLKKLQQSDAQAVSVSDLSDLQDDLDQARAASEVAEAQVEQIRTEIARHTVRAPVDGIVLQFHTRLGEYAEAAKMPLPILILGRDGKLQVRVNIDEAEISRFHASSKAVAYVRGSPDTRFPLTFEYLEKYVVPKTNLTGLSTERTDVRVLQVIYSFSHGDEPVFVGQQLDVFIQAKLDVRDDTAGLR